MSPQPVELRGVIKRYGKITALHGIDLDVHEGEILGLLGPNGSGKSTCLRILTGLTFRTSGEARVLGIDPGRRPVAVRRRTCYLSGESVLYGAMTGRQALAFGTRGYRLRQDPAADQLRAAFPLPLDRRVRAYSAGMKQKLALLVALLPDVDLYLLDEPDRNLDPTSQEIVRTAIRERQSAGKTIVYCSHDVRSVDAVANRTVFFRSGRVLAQETIDAARSTLRSEIRIRVREGTELPPGAEAVTREPDGFLRVRTAGDPMRWIAQLDADAVISVELGTTRLDLLYRQLAAPEAGP